MKCPELLHQSRLTAATRAIYLETVDVNAPGLPELGQCHVSSLKQGKSPCSPWGEGVSGCPSSGFSLTMPESPEKHNRSFTEADVTTMSPNDMIQIVWGAEPKGPVGVARLLLSMLAKTSDLPPGGGVQELLHKNKQKSPLLRWI